MSVKTFLFRKRILIPVAVIAVYALAGFFLLPVVGKNILQKNLSRSLNRDVAVEKIAVNPFALTVTIDALTVTDKNKAVFFSAQKMGADLSFVSLFTLTPVVSDLFLENPYVNIVRNEDGSFDFSDLLNSGKSRETVSNPEDSRDKEIFGFVLKNVRMDRGELRFADKAAHVSHRVNDVSLSLPFLSSRKKDRYAPSGLDIHFVLNQAAVDVHVESTPFAEDLSTRVDIKTSDMDVIHYLSYLPVPGNVRLNGLDLNLDFHARYQKKNSNDSLLLEGTLNALNADVTDAAGEEIIKFPTLSIDMSGSDILAGQLNISKVLMLSPTLNVNRDNEGQLNLVGHIPQDKEGRQTGADAKTADGGKNPFVLRLEAFEIKDAVFSFRDFAGGTVVTSGIPEFSLKGAVIDAGNKKIDTGIISVQNGDLLLKRTGNGQATLVKTVRPEKGIQHPSTPAVEVHSVPAEAGTAPWDVTLTAVDVNGFKVRFNDLTNKDPVTVNLTNISVQAENLKTLGRETGSVKAQMNWNEKGRIRIHAGVIPSMLSAGLDIGLEKIDIQCVQPYFTDAVRILVTDGNINAKGKLTLDMGDKSKENIRFSGETSLTNFISLDKQTAKDFFKCKSLYLSGLDVSLFPVKVKARDISLTDFYSRIIISDTGDINLNTIFKEAATGGQGAGPEKQQEKISSEPPQISVESVTLQGGNISFSDYLTQPNFTAGMKQIAGSVTGLSSDEQSRAKLVLQGIHGQSSPLDIVGTINPLAQKKFTDIDISFKDIELTNFTPYSAKYLGYKIEKGKLVLDLEYKIEGNQLISENRVRFDNFTLGERVKSEDAVSLPIGLAIALLKNRDGQIDLDLPVKGALDDPKFKIGSIVFKMISNLILKVVTSPFSIIGGMFGGGEELGYIDFQYGETGIENPDYEKLDKLAQILLEKPSINLEIKGLHDVLRDAEGLRTKEFYNLIKAEKLKEMTASGSGAATLEDVVIKAEELEYYINSAYARAQFPKPRDEKDREKELDVEEKKKLLMTNISIGKNELRLLSMTRSEMIKAYLISTGKLEKERIFLLDPGETDNSNAERKSKVTFLLK